MNGILNVLKPTGMSSHDVVSFVRKAIGMKKVGHAGTLDPNVAGVLPICIGKGTKFSDMLINGDKEYICEIKFGQSTDTQDVYGKVVEEIENFEFNTEEVINVINSFKGIIYQIPPAYSAVKFNGKRLYEYARQDIIIEKEARQANIKSLDILKINEPNVLLKVKCSKGTYMRTLCHDIGIKLGIPAHMGILIRSEAKGLKIKDSLSLEELSFFAQMNRIEEHIISVDDIVHMEKVVVSEKYYDKLIVGNEVYCYTSDELLDDFYVYCKDMLIGIGHKVDAEHVKINKMLM
jgi:tRNA pseudouridine55 synthase